MPQNTVLIIYSRCYSKAPPSSGNLHRKLVSRHNVSIKLVLALIRVIRLLAHFKNIVPLESIESGVYGVLIIIYTKPYSIYLRGTISLNPKP